MGWNNILEEKVSMKDCICPEKLFNLTLPEAGDLEKLLSKMSGLMDQLKSIAKYFQEKVKTILILSGLSESYDSLINALENRDNLIFSHVISHLKEEAIK